MTSLQQAAHSAFLTVGGVDAEAGSPAQVYNVDGEASYWLIPLESAGSLVGICRILESGQVLTVGPSRSGARDAASSVTGLTREEAIAKAGLSSPRLVHDGPPGREAWMFDGPQGRVFAAGGGVYPAS